MFSLVYMIKGARQLYIALIASVTVGLVLAALLTWISPRLDSIGSRGFIQFAIENLLVNQDLRSVLSVAFMFGVAASVGRIFVETIRRLSREALARHSVVDRRAAHPPLTYMIVVAAALVAFPLYVLGIVTHQTIAPSLGLFGYLLTFMILIVTFFLTISDLWMFFVFRKSERHKKAS